jgi:AcrR family transcriptional regulator
VLRETKKARTREELVDAAHELFVAHGFDETTVEQIAERAGVGRRTFFRYFPTKEAVFFADDLARLGRFSAALAARANSEPALVAVRRLLLGLAAELEQSRSRARTHHELIRTSRTLRGQDFELDNRWEETISDALAADPRGAPPGVLPELWARVASGALMGVIRAVLRHWFDSGARGALTDLGRKAFELLNDGLAVERAEGAVP